MLDELFKRIKEGQKQRREKMQEGSNIKLKNTIEFMSGLSFSWYGSGDYDFLNQYEVKEILRKELERRLTKTTK